jgi:hypothetical protein
VKDQVQFTFKVEYREQAVLEEIVESQPMIAQLREQIRGRDEVATRDIRVRLGELVSIALEQVRQLDGRAVGERLSPFSTGFAVDPLESEYMVLNAAFLVERRRMDEFERAASDLANEQSERMRCTLLGPMPAYNFVGLGSPAWA